MLKRKALMESVSSNLHNFLKKTGKNLSLTDKKFRRESDPPCESHGEAGAIQREKVPPEGAGGHL